jgi:outer membrane receptor protein involved in Fe transport
MRDPLLFSTSVLAMLAPVVASAQTSQTPSATPGVSAEADVSSADDIVVTAQRRAQRLQDVPVSVSVVSGDALQKAGITNIGDLSQRLPNVKITSGGNSDFINIRGVGSGQNPGFEQSVATFVDGDYRGRSRATRAALFDVERVEVLKGPQTTFFGNNAIAGALNITSRKPDQQFDYNASALGGTYGEFQLQGGVSVPLTDTLAVRVAGRYNGSDGYVRNEFTGRDGPRTRELIGRVVVVWKPSDNFNSTLRFDRGRNRNRETYNAQLLNCPQGACGVFGGALVPGFDDQLDKRTASPPTYSNYDFKEVSWTNSLDLGDFSINAITGYFDHDFSQLTQQIPAPVLGVGGGGLLPVYTAETYKSYSQEIRLQSRTGGVFEWMIGGYYFHGDLGTDLYTGFRFPVSTPFGFLQFGQLFPAAYDAASPITVNLLTSQKEETKSGFASATVRPMPDLRVNLGARYTVVDKSAARSIVFGTADADPSNNFVAGPPAATAFYTAITGSDALPFARPSRTDKKFMPSIGLQYDIQKDAMIYANYTKGFKAGGYGYGTRPDIFDPETVNAYEVGAKGSFLDRRLNVNLALFLSDYGDLQESNTLFVNGQILSVINNAAEARAKGVEGGFSYRFSPALSFNLDAAYLDARYRSYPNASCTIGQQLATPAGAPCVQNMAGKRRAFAPEWSGSFGATLTVPVDNAELRFSPLAYFTSKYFVAPTADPLLEQSGNIKFDATLAIGPADRRWEFAIIGRNLTDRTTASFRSSAFFPGATYALTDPPRTVAVQFSIRR